MYAGARVIRGKGKANGPVVGVKSMNQNSKEVKILLRMPHYPWALHSLAISLSESLTNSMLHLWRCKLGLRLHDSRQRCMNRRHLLLHCSVLGLREDITETKGYNVT